MFMEYNIGIEQVRIGINRSALAISMSELLNRIAQKRDKNAFKELFINYAPKIKGLFLKQGVNAETAEELTQETLLTVWKKAELYSSNQGSASTWIFTIARNLRIDRLRAEKIWSVMDYTEFEQVSDDKLQDETYWENQRKEKLNKILKQLPKEQYDIVYLSYIESKSHSEIAEQLDVPLGTVKSRIRLAFKKIKTLLEEKL